MYYFSSFQNFGTFNLVYIAKCQTNCKILPTFTFLLDYVVKKWKD